MIDGWQAFTVWGLLGVTGATAAQDTSEPGSGDTCTTFKRLGDGYSRGSRELQILDALARWSSCHRSRVDNR